MSSYGAAATDLAKQSNLAEGLESSLRDFISWNTRRLCSTNDLGTSVAKSGLLSQSSSRARA